MKITVWNPTTGQADLIYEGTGDVTVTEPDTGIRIISNCEHIEEFITLRRASQPRLEVVENTPIYDEEE